MGQKLEGLKKKSDFGVHTEIIVVDEINDIAADSNRVANEIEFSRVLLIQSKATRGWFENSSKLPKENHREKCLRPNNRFLPAIFDRIERRQEFLRPSTKF